MVDKFYVRLGDNSIKNSRIKILKPYAHLHNYHKKKVYKISTASNERCRRSYGDKIMVGEV